MKMLADTSGVIALINRKDRHHADVVRLVSLFELVVPVSILPEVDYMVTKYLGERVSRAFFEDVNSGAFSYLGMDASDISKAIEVMRAYSDIPIGFVNASLASLADQHKIQNILTLDRRHFDIIQSNQFPYFALLP
ncbi:type II toxin-antitoxin system VapC family toxin [Synechococcus sp. PCC 6312]|uniref:type II toxin-antitoxin system VapC family toxin n=1 Tax=Synechococcus sp. (strain ATCC 27167 / PCC 6312) TaxID=195253 RepID=UPI00029EF09C|nr:PIN domain-containing protein [Synechococcus sp. PCC 6312]AFY62380.1 putative nucleic acid-binding protein, contains PIN domain [Synechococcus sp. PCC 6312]